MRYIILSVKKFSYKDKISGELKPAVIVYGMDEKGITVKPLFFSQESYQKYNFDKYVLNTKEIDSLYKDYKSCQIDFDQAGFITKLSD